jgi:hypothetical protein
MSNKSIKRKRNFNINTLGYLLTGDSMSKALDLLNELFSVKHDLYLQFIPDMRISTKI